MPYRIRALWPVVVLAAIAAALIPRAASAQEPRIITTFAGDGGWGYAGDGGPATSARLRAPSGMAVAADGSLYIADTKNHRIRRVDPDGVITTVAGTGSSGDTGDGGPAVEARLSQPHDVAVAADGTLYIADTHNNRIRMVTPAGVISTIAGTGTYGSTGDNDVATAAELAQPRGLALQNDGSVLIADTFSGRVRRIGPNGTITTLAGTGATGFAGDNGPALEAQLAHPHDVATMPDGSILVADTTNSRIRKILPSGIITTAAGNGAVGSGGDGASAINSELSYPRGLTVAHDGTVLIADVDNNRVRMVTPDGVISTVAGDGVNAEGPDGVDAITSSLAAPQGVAVAADGRVFIADTDANRVRVVAGVIPPASDPGAGDEPAPTDDPPNGDLPQRPGPATPADSAPSNPVADPRPVDVPAPPRATPPAACVGRVVVLTGVREQRGRVRIAGLASRALAGRRVSVVFRAGGATVGRATVRPDGSFRMSAPPPRPALRARAAYVARIGSARSDPAPLTQRVVVTGTRRSGGTVTVTGRVAHPPAAGRAGTPVVVQQRDLDGCAAYRTLPGTGSLDARGRFRVTVAVPRGAGMVLRLRATVGINRTGTRTTAALSLPVAA